MPCSDSSQWNSRAFFVASWSLSSLDEPIWLISSVSYALREPLLEDLRLPLVLGTVLTGSANLLLAIINTSSTYWAFSFPAAITSVFGADFVFAAGSIFIAKEALPIEQSMAGALFNKPFNVDNRYLHEPRCTDPGYDSGSLSS